MSRLSDNKRLQVLLRWPSGCNLLTAAGQKGTGAAEGDVQLKVGCVLTSPDADRLPAYACHCVPAAFQRQAAWGSCEAGGPLHARSTLLQPKLIIAEVVNVRELPQQLDDPVLQQWAAVSQPAAGGMGSRGQRWATVDGSGHRVVKVCGKAA